MTFPDAKIIGDEAEMAVAAAFLRAGWFVQKPDAYCRYDLVVFTSARTELVEVKNEIAFAASGNICIETSQRSGPSGINASHSTVWIHWFGERCVMYRTQDMRMWVSSKAPKWFPRSDNGNFGHILPVADLRNFYWFDDRAVPDIP